ncbi:hypothetical protein [Phytomonospora endophytica]|uniref:Uncharacterized protein n=1 Tax=Phytomonospora endophytica TaxID=714109 RepID=A0A841FR80_9ACTN|nr:hypothetical protein [Phytomonospora endophytica]MBB6036288.1 hypothetical protein [Phytomonospora endophytica]GIG67195.1 hypothetical protein Pen01_34900 [Phytomonospora endophytica]
MNTRRRAAAAAIVVVLLSGGVAALANPPTGHAADVSADREGGMALDALGRIETILAVAGGKLLPGERRVRARRPLPGRIVPPVHPTIPASRSNDLRPAR